MADTRMIRTMSGPRLHERHPDRDLMTMTGLEDISDMLRRQRLRWYGHVERKDGEEWTKKVWKEFEVDGQPRLTWDKIVEKDCTKLRLDPGIAHDRTAWRKAIGERHTQ